MDSGLFARAAVVQALLVAALFGLLIALPLGDDFFEDYGYITGPVAWIGCAAATGAILKLPRDLVIFAAVAGGVAGFLVSLPSSHTIGLLVAVAVFGASCGGYEEMQQAGPDGPESNP
jgi:hypothetical protein